MQTENPNQNPSALSNSFGTHLRSYFKNFVLEWRDHASALVISQQKFIKESEEIKEKIKINEQVSSQLSSKKKILLEMIEILDSKLRIQNEIFSKNQVFEVVNSESLNENLESLKKETFELEEQVKKFENLLGLKIMRFNDCIRFAFSHIVRNNSGKHFVEMTRSNDCYVLVDCSPWISEIENFVLVLNKTQDLTMFLKNVRKGFKLLYN